MARLLNPTINLVMIKTRVRKDGTCPIVVRIQWKGRSEKFTNVYVQPSQWNEKTQKVVKRNDANELNLKLSEMLNDFQMRCKVLIDKGLPFKSSDLLSNQVCQKVAHLNNNLIYSDLVDEYIKLRKLSVSSCLSHKTTASHLVRYNNGKDIEVMDIDWRFLISFASDLTSRGLADSTVYQILKNIGTIIRYAMDEEYLPDGYKYPYNRFKYWEKYSSKSDKKDASIELIKAMQNKFMELYDNDRDRLVSRCKCRTSKEFALCACLLCFYFQGIAFVDLVRIKKGNIRRISVKGEGEYIVIEGMVRQKTKVAIGYIPVQLTTLTERLIVEMFLSSIDERDGYLVPVLQNNKCSFHYDTEAKRKFATGTATTAVNKNIREIVKELGFDEDITYYSFRHSFATQFIANGGNPSNLAKLMGRSPNGIFRYVTELTGLEATIKEKNRIKIMGDKNDWFIEDWLNSL